MNRPLFVLISTLASQLALSIPSTGFSIPSTALAVEPAGGQGLSVMAQQPESQSQPRRIPLGGAWQYRLDPGNIGLEQKWYAGAFDGSQSLQFPGTLDDAGIGPEPELSADTISREVMLHLTRKHRYEGVAWYRREVTVPENWSAKESRLFLERVLWKSTLWIDGTEVGSRESLNAPHKYDLGDLLSPGKHVLVLRIDNGKQYDISHRDMAHAYTNETQIMWNGVLGGMYLEAIPDAAISSLQVFPDAENRAVTAELGLENHLPEAADVKLELTVLLGTETVQRKEIALRLDTGTSGHNATIALGEVVKLWDEFNPNLYTLRAVLLPAGAGEAAPGKNAPGKVPPGRSAPDETGAGEAAPAAVKATDFGFRKMETRGEELFLNDRRLFLRGTLECSIFPLTGHPPTGKSGWEKVFSTARSYGLNHLRFHSWCPPEAAFEVADSMGFYLQAELPLWIMNFGEDKAAVSFIKAEAQRMIAAYGNHPSFCFWSLGNELQGDFEVLRDLLLQLKQQDPRRLYTTTTFTFQDGHGDWPEPDDDFFVTQWTRKGWVRGQGIFNDRYPDFQTDYSAAIDSMPVPVITHEIGQYSVYPNLEEIKKYTGVLQPLNFMAVKKDLGRKHLLGLAPAFTQASGKLAVLLYKEEIERALKTRGMSGFQLLDLHDFPGQGTALVGILDAFWDSKGLIRPEDFREFCSPVVPLLRFPKAVYTNEEYFEAGAELSNYSAKELTSMGAEWKISRWQDNAATEIASGTFGTTSAPSGSLTVLGSIRASLASIKKASRLTVEISIPGTAYRNEWSIWVYPVAPPPPAPEDVVFTRSASEALKLLADGKKVLLNPDTADLAGVDGRFTQVFWSPVHFPDQPGTMGLLCDPAHPALAAFPTDFHTNWQWWDLIMRSKSMVIDSLPPTEPLVRIIDNFFKNRKMALIIEAKLGPGSLVICSADIGADLENRPAARQLRHSLLQYMASGAFRPETVLSETDLRSLMRPAR